LQRKINETGGHQNRKVVGKKFDKCRKMKNVIIIKVMKEDVREATMVKEQLEGQK
jgi:hypothetical protein